MGGELFEIAVWIESMDHDQRRAHGRPENLPVYGDDVRAEVRAVVEAAVEKWMAGGREGGLPGAGIDYVKYWNVI